MAMTDESCLMTSEMCCDGTVSRMTSSESPSKDQRKRIKRRVQGDKTCTVCGDKAIAHNFGTLTCETCKAFFRRNAQRTQEIAPCAFEKKCVINKTTRRFCPSCRMDKCFSVGMDPSLILGDDEKEAMRARRKTNTRGKQQAARAAEDHTEIDSSSHLYSAIEVSIQSASCSMMRESLHPDFSTDAASTTTTISAHSLSESLSPISAAISNFYEDFTATAPNSEDTTHVADPLTSEASSATGTVPFSDGVTTNAARVCDRGSSAQHMTHGDLYSPASSAAFPHRRAAGDEGERQAVAQGLAFRHVEREQLPWDIQMYWPLTADERSLLTLIANCYSNIQIAVHQRPPDDPPPPPPANHPLGVDNLMYVLDATLRRCVSFAKAVPDFKSLQEVDQIACLKASALQTYIMRSSALYILERKAWHTYVGDVTLEDLQARFQSASVRLFAEYCAALKSVARTNSTLYALLHCLALFDARDAKLEDRIKVNALRDKYFQLLKHYLESEFSYRHSGRYLVEILALLEDVHRLKDKVMGFYNQFSGFFRPLVAEFFAT